MIGATLPAGISFRQYPQVIYPPVHENNNAQMGQQEHWRQRLLELKEDLQLKQAAMAQAMEVDASYFSRLLYPPGKKGRKNLGLDTMLACRKAFNLPADWFDLPLGAGLPSGRKSIPGDQHRVTTPTDQSSVVPIGKLTWPFKQVSYRRLVALKSALGPKLGANAMHDIDELLDVAVTKWERLIPEKKKPSKKG